MERCGPYKLSWAHALFVAAGTLTMLQVPQLDAALLHVLLNGFGWGALYETDADFAGPFGGAPPAGSAATACGPARSTEMGRRHTMDVLHVNTQQHMYLLCSASDHIRQASSCFC